MPKVMNRVMQDERLALGGTVISEQSHLAVHVVKSSSRIPHDAHTQLPAKRHILSRQQIKQVTPLCELGHDVHGVRVLGRRGQSLLDVGSTGHIVSHIRSMSAMHSYPLHSPP